MAWPASPDHSQATHECVAWCRLGASRGGLGLHSAQCIDENIPRTSPSTLGQPAQCRQAEGPHPCGPPSRRTLPSSRPRRASSPLPPRRLSSPYRPRLSRPPRSRLRLRLRLLHPPRRSRLPRSRSRLRLLLLLRLPRRRRPRSLSEELLRPLLLLGLGLRHLEGAARRGVRRAVSTERGEHNAERGCTAGGTLPSSSARRPRPRPPTSCPAGGPCCRCCRGAAAAPPRRRCARRAWRQGGTSIRARPPGSVGRPLDRPAQSRRPQLKTIAALPVPPTPGSRDQARTCRRASSWAMASGPRWRRTASACPWSLVCCKGPLSKTCRGSSSESWRSLPAGRASETPGGLSIALEERRGLPCGLSFRPVLWAQESTLPPSGRCCLQIIGALGCGAVGCFIEL